MKTRNKLLLTAGLSLGLAEFANEMGAVFETILGAGDKLKLAGLTDLSREQKIMEEDNKNEKEKRKRWEQNGRNTACYVKGYDDAPIYCKIYIQQEISDKWAVVVHGYGCDGSALAHASKKFYDRGLNVVAPDLRCHGRSGGKYIGMGFTDCRDIINIIRLIIRGNKNAKIYLYGVSMGAASVLMAASERLPENVRAVISDCSFESADGIIGYELMHNLGLPPFPLVNILNMLCIKRAGYDLRLASPIDRVARIKIPTLFIHGENDRLVPTKTAYKLYKKARCKKALMIIRGAGHGVSALVDGERYWRGVFGFIERAG